MNLPVHRWFRYSAGFSAQWVKTALQGWHITKNQMVLDPFVGSGTVPLVCDTLGLSSIGIDAHPMVSRICKAKLLWDTDLMKFVDFSEKVLRKYPSMVREEFSYPPLILRSFDTSALISLDALKSSWVEVQDGSAESELVWLALTSILRSTSSAGTAQWQYILPNRIKKKIVEPISAFQQQIQIIKDDMNWMQQQELTSCATIITGDSRNLANHAKNIDAVVTSPPYANNYDYADALRFEMSFWGEVNGWGDIHDAVRKYLIVSSSQHSSKEKLKLEILLSDVNLLPIRNELTQVVNTLADVRESHGGKKHYHTMIAAYCRDISLVLQQLRKVCKPGVHMGWVIGDSAPYGVYCPIEIWIAELALAAGFNTYKFEKLRDRNTKWKNRKHRVPLKEGILWIEG